MLTEEMTALAQARKDLSHKFVLNLAFDEVEDSEACNEFVGVGVVLYHGDLALVAGWVSRDAREGVAGAVVALDTPRWVVEVICRAAITRQRPFALTLAGTHPNV